MSMNSSKHINLSLLKEKGNPHQGFPTLQTTNLHLNLNNNKTNNNHKKGRMFLSKTDKPKMDEKTTQPQHGYELFFFLYKNYGFGQKIFLS